MRKRRKKYADSNDSFGFCGEGSEICKYSCGFDVESGYSCVDGKSLVGLFSLDISKPLQLTINDGEGEIEDVLRDIQEFMEY